MISYEVRIRLPDFEVERYVRYLKEIHIPDLMATGCFISARLFRERVEAGEGSIGRLRSSYLAPDAEALNRYLTLHAPRLRAHATEHFPVGLEIERELWSPEGSWGEV
jgi:hypothetical protein